MAVTWCQTTVLLRRVCSSTPVLPCRFPTLSTAEGCSWLRRHPITTLTRILMCLTRWRQRKQTLCQVRHTPTGSIADKITQLTNRSNMKKTTVNLARCRCLANARLSTTRMRKCTILQLKMDPSSISVTIISVNKTLMKLSTTTMILSNSTRKSWKRIVKLKRCHPHTTLSEANRPILRNTAQLILQGQPNLKNSTL